MFGQLGQPWSRLAPRATWASREGRRLQSPRGGGLLRKVTGPRPEERAAEGLRQSAARPAPAVHGLKSSPGFPASVSPNAWCTPFLSFRSMSAPPVRSEAAFFP